MRRQAEGRLRRELLPPNCRSGPVGTSPWSWVAGFQPFPACFGAVAPNGKATRDKRKNRELQSRPVGYVKNRLIEQGEHGHSLDLAKEGLGVCPSCIDDDGLRHFVASRAQNERCDFCGGPGPHGLTLGVLFDYMGDRIGTEYDRAIDTLFLGEGDDLWESGGATVYDAADLLWELGDPLGNDGLRDAFVEAFEDDRISSHAFRLAHHERLAYGWETFARLVKEKSRYLFLRTEQGPQGDEELIPPDELLDRMAQAIENGDLIRRLPAGSQLVRARQHASGEVLSTPVDLGSPPPGCAGVSRMSPPGIAMFYGAADAETALAELRLEAFPRMATVGTWVTARPLRFLDLVDVDVPSIFDMVGKVQRPWRLFLKGFADNVSQPPDPGEEAVHYVPTQIFTEYVRDALGGSGEPVRGIRYRSAVRPPGVCWVLFVDAAGCTETASEWETDHGHWLALQPTSLRRFQLTQSWTEIT